MNRDKICLYGLLILLLTGIASIVAPTIIISPTGSGDNSNTTDNQTDTGSTTTTTTTTTTAPSVAEFRFKAMWDYQPKMQISKPYYLSVGIMADDDLGESYSDLLVFNENQWYIKSDGYIFTEGMTYRLIVSDSSGIYDGINNQPYIRITAGSVGYQWDLTNNSEDWGDLFFEWVVV